MQNAVGLRGVELQGCIDKGCMVEGGVMVLRFASSLRVDRRFPPLCISIYIEFANKKVECQKQNTKCGKQIRKKRTAQYIKKSKTKKNRAEGKRLRATINVVTNQH